MQWRFGVGERIRYAAPSDDQSIYIVRHIHEPEAGTGPHQMLALNRVEDDGTLTCLEGRFCSNQFVGAGA